VPGCDFSIKERKKPDTSAAAKVVTLERRIGKHRLD